MARQSNILALDDDPAMRELLLIAFRDLPVHVSVAEDEAEARSLVNEQSFDLFLVDLQLGNSQSGTRSGLEAAEQILIHADMRIPIIVVSAQTSDSLQKYVDSGRCLGFKTKPIWLRTFGAEIMHYLTETPVQLAVQSNSSGTVGLELAFLKTALAQAHELQMSSDLDLLKEQTLARAAHRWIGTSGIGCLPKVSTEARRLEALAVSKDASRIPEIRCLLSRLVEKFESASSSPSCYATQMGTTQGEI